MQDIINEDVKKILIIKFAGLGDIVMLFSVAQKLKQKYKNAKIDILCDEKNGDIIRCTDYIAEAITINRDVFRKKRVFKSIYEIFKITKFTLSSRYDIVIDVQSVGESALITRFLNAKIKIGAPKSGKESAYTKCINRHYNTKTTHRVSQYSKIACVDESIAFPKISLTQKGIISKNRFVDKIDDKKKTIGLNIGSTNENRRWSEQNFSKLADILNSKFNVIVFFGSAEDGYIKSFNKSINLVHSVGLEELCGIISLCDFFISNDTGPVHIAAALNVPTLTLFSTGEDINVGALIETKESIRKQNINDIKIDEVLKKLEKLIDKSLK